jgi:rhamnulokinase
MKNYKDFLAVDLGASGGRVLLGRWDGNAFELQELHRFPNGPVSVLGHLHWDALRLWQEILAGMGRYAATFGAAPDGVGLDTWGVDYALLDRAGHLLGNPYHYRDRRTDGLVERACALVPRREIFEQTGIQFMQLNTLIQLLAMAEAAEPQLEMADTLLMMPDLFNYWFTGRRAAEYTDASTSQMLLARDRAWATDMLAHMHIPTGMLPEIVPPGAVFGETRPDVIAEAGLPRPVPVISVASHDTASAVAAIPDLGPDSAYISSGTWSLIGMEVPEPIINEQVLELNFTNEGGLNGTIRLLKNVAGLWLLQESRRRWARAGRDYTWDELLDLAREAPPFRSLVDPDAPDFLSPGDMPAAIRAYCASTSQPEPEDVGAVVRCCLESLALKSRWVINCLEKLSGRRVRTVHVVGGGSQNRLLCQFTADACERPVVAGPVEATAMGNIMVQAIATGHLDDVATGRQAVGASFQRHHYQPQEAAAWQDAFGRFASMLSLA